MAFSTVDILEEFVEASRTTGDYSALAEAGIYGVILDRKRRGAEYRADPWRRRCMRQYRARPENKMKALAYQRLWMEKPENRARNRATVASWYQRNAEYKKAKSKEWYHSGAGLVARHKWLAANKEKRKATRKASDARYRASEKGKAARARERSK